MKAGEGIMKREKQIHQHFEKEAKEFDDIIQQLIPNYNQMIEAAVESIPFSKEQPISVIDLGCGTGTVAQAVKNKYPNATITCVDLSNNMLKLANQKLGGHAICIESDFETLDFIESYDVVISSLALHHLEDLKTRGKFYPKLYQAINKDGVFINIDIFLASNPILQKTYIEKWVDFMKQQISLEEINDRWLVNHYEEDRPVPLMDELNLLTEIGFIGIDVVYKYYNFGVYIGQK